jgi:glycosyltransferase involved in cell wall biosynthesis
VKTLTLVASTGRPDRAELRRREAADEQPRVLLFEDRLCSDIMEGGRTRPPLRYLVQAWRAYRMRRQYDVVLTWGEPLSLLFALILKLTGARTRHVALMYWISPPKKALFLRAVQSHIDRIVTWSSVQRAFGIERLGIPADTFTLVRYPVDQDFWRPAPGAGDGDMIVAVGNEMRDYPTLIRAMRDLPMPCHIAARDIQRGASKKLATRASMLAAGPIPPNVTIGQKSYADLRALYARSRFVVIPVKPTDTDNGVTTALEAMAMGKAVICTRTRGQVDVIEEGKTGIFVPQGDAAALREAIRYLWDRPGVADAMGRAGRARVEERHSFEQFVDSVRSVVDQVLTEPRLVPAQA